MTKRTSTMIRRIQNDQENANNDQKDVNNDQNDVDNDKEDVKNNQEDNDNDKDYDKDDWEVFKHPRMPSIVAFCSYQYNTEFFLTNTGELNF